MKQSHLFIAQSLTTPTVIDYSTGVPVIQPNVAFNAAVQSLFVMSIEDPASALDVIYYAAGHTDDESTLDILTAGPLETLLRRHGSSLSETIQRYSAQSPVFRSMVEGAA